MGIINVTPDSFSGDGLLRDEVFVAQALATARQMLVDGADILDIGGESSRPGSVSLSVEEEVRRVVPVVAAIRKELGEGVQISVDTVKAEVARQALQAGANLINDISALTADADTAAVVAERGAAVVLMHNRGLSDAVTRDAKIGGVYDAPAYQDVVVEVVRELAIKAEQAIAAGIAREKIIIDPGIGFGKTPQQNMALIMQLGRIRELGFPVLMGVSRKSFIGYVLDTSVEERLEGTAACVTASILQGADIVRVHDVKFMARIVHMATALRDV